MYVYQEKSFERTISTVGLTKRPSLWHFFKEWCQAQKRHIKYIHVRNLIITKSNRTHVYSKTFPEQALGTKCLIEEMRQLKFVSVSRLTKNSRLQKDFITETVRYPYLLFQMTYLSINSRKVIKEKKKKVGK